MIKKNELVKRAKEAAKKEYEKQLAYETAKEQLLSSHANWSLLETIIQNVNSNPDLKVVVRLNDGTSIEIKTTCENSKMNSFEVEHQWISDSAFEVFK